MHANTPPSAVHGRASRGTDTMRGTLARHNDDGERRQELLDWYSYVDVYCLELFEGKNRGTRTNFVHTRTNTPSPTPFPPQPRRAFPWNLPAPRPSFAPSLRSASISSCIVLFSLLRFGGAPFSSALPERGFVFIALPCSYRECTLRADGACVFLVAPLLSGRFI